MNIQVWAFLAMLAIAFILIAVRGAPPYGKWVCTKSWGDVIWVYKDGKRERKSTHCTEWTEQ